MTRTEYVQLLFDNLERLEILEIDRLDKKLGVTTYETDAPLKDFRRRLVSQLDQLESTIGGAL